MTAPTLPDTVNWEDLESEFELQCDVIEEGMLTGISDERCQRAAKKIGMVPCCRRTVQSCLEHVTDGKPWWCPGCDKMYPSSKLNWIDL